MGTKMKSKGLVVALAKQLIAGTDKHLANAAQVTFAGGSYTPSQITAKLQQVVSLREAVDAAKASTKARVAAEKADMPALRTFIGALVAYVKAIHGTSPELLADFGLNPKARAPLTVEAKVAAAVKRNATRAARHTMGAKQKKVVKGAVTGIVVTPLNAGQPSVTTPSSPNAPATSGSTTAATTPRA
jgi:hypothetical protein